MADVKNSKILRNNTLQQLTQVIVHVRIIIGNIQTYDSFIDYDI
ncbi:hypothetical protein [uncultured Ruminococcus sp.]|nr:hypothetical protein [uncultured Ruminococcus sp.]